MPVIAKTAMVSSLCVLYMYATIPLKSIHRHIGNIYQVTERIFKHCSPRLTGIGQRHVSEAFFSRREDELTGK